MRKVLVPGTYAGDMETLARHCNLPEKASGMVPGLAVNMASKRAVTETSLKIVLFIFFGMYSVSYRFGNGAYAGFEKCTT